MSFVRVSVWNPDPHYGWGMICYKHAFENEAKWRGLRPGLVEFDCDDSELGEIKYQCAQLGAAVFSRPCFSSDT